MEMEFNDGRSRGRFVIIMGLILAVVAGGAAFFLISQAQQQADPRSRPTVSIVVATRPIPPRKPIEAADVAVRAVPLDATNAQGVFSDPTKVIGLMPGVAILSGQPIYANFLASQAQGGQFSILQPGETLSPDSEAWRAVSVTVPDDRAVGRSRPSRRHRRRVRDRVRGRPRGHRPGRQVLHRQDHQDHLPGRHRPGQGRGRST